MAFEYVTGVVVGNDLCQTARVYPLVAQMTAKIHKVNYESPKKPWLWKALEHFIDLIPETYTNAENELKWEELVEYA